MTRFLKTQILHRLNDINTLFDKLMRKIIPSVPVEATCPDNYEYYIDTQLGYECWESTSCGSNKCVKVFSRKYYYIYPSSGTCTQLMKICNSRNCIGTAECAGS